MNWCSGEVSKSAKSPNLLVFKVNFLYQKLSESFSIFFSLKNINLGAHFLLLTFFDNFKIEQLLFLKWRLIFDTSPLTQFSKFNNFLWVCWFLGKNLSNFVSPVWKLYNPYCHSVRSMFRVLGIYNFGGGTKLERFLPKNLHTQRKLLNFENWVT